MNPKVQAAQVRAPLSLCTPAGLVHESWAMNDGAVKYGPFNWRDESISYMEYIAAMQRHLADLINGQDQDAKSKVHHLGHVKATCGILLDAIECGNIIDDRPTKHNYQCATTCSNSERPRKSITEMVTNYFARRNGHS